MAGEWDHSTTMDEVERTAGAVAEAEVREVSAFVGSE